MKIFIDCEFDGHNGKLMSMAAVTQGGEEIYIICGDHADPQDPWVVENVLPYITSHNCDNTHFTDTANGVGRILRFWLRQFRSIEIIADSPVDIARFCQAVSTKTDGSYCPNDFAHINFSVYNINSYPTKLQDAVQHNAWWDAKTFMYKLQELVFI